MKLCRARFLGRILENLLASPLPLSSEKMTVHLKRIPGFLISMLFFFAVLCCIGVRAEDAAQPKSAMIVLIFDTHCKTACELVRPIMRELKGEFKDCFTFVELDSSQEKLSESQAKAKEMGIHPFLASYAQYVPIVGVFNAKKKCIRVIDGAKTKDVYAQALQKALQCN